MDMLEVWPWWNQQNKRWHWHARERTYLAWRWNGRVASRSLSWVPFQTTDVHSWALIMSCFHVYSKARCSFHNDDSTHRRLVSLAVEATTSTTTTSSFIYHGSHLHRFSLPRLHALVGSPAVRGASEHATVIVFVQMQHLLELAFLVASTRTLVSFGCRSRVTVPWCTVIGPNASRIRCGHHRNGCVKLSNRPWPNVLKETRVAWQWQSMRCSFFSRTTDDLIVRPNTMFQGMAFLTGIQQKWNGYSMILSTMLVL